MLVTLLGKKLGMTQVYDDGNNLVPVTVIEAGPCPVTQIKTKEKDGYTAVQIGFADVSDKHLSKARQGHLTKAGAKVRHLKEVRANEGDDLPGLGHVYTVEAFAAGGFIDVTGVTRGKGFQGVVKRFRTKGGRASHGSMSHRRVGSIGMCQDPGRVVKNQIMPGHMGARSRTTQNLKVVKIIPEKNLILVQGSVPGGEGSLITVRNSLKKSKKKGVA